MISSERIKSLKEKRKDMLALFAICVQILMIGLMIQGFRLPYKFVVKKYKSKVLGIICGALGVTFVLSIFWGDSIYNYLQYRRICMTETINNVYDQEAYERYLKTAKDRKHITLKGEELSTFMNKYDIQDYDYTRGASLDKDNNYLYFVKQNKDSRHFLDNVLVNLNDKQLIREYKNYYGGRLGWFCHAFHPDGIGCGFDSCKSNKLGAFDK